MISVGPENFGAFLDGAYAFDTHFRSAPFEKNLPMILGMVGWYQRNVLGYTSRAVIPYDQRLSRFAAYLQQLDMESNGKGVVIDGAPVDGSSGPSSGRAGHQRPACLLPAPAPGHGYHPGRVS